MNCRSVYIYRADSYTRVPTTVSECTEGLLESYVFLYMIFFELDFCKAKPKSFSHVISDPEIIMNDSSKKKNLYAKFLIYTACGPTPH